MNHTKIIVTLLILFQSATCMELANQKTSTMLSQSNKLDAVTNEVINMLHNREIENNEKKTNEIIKILKSFPLIEKRAILAHEKGDLANAIRLDNKVAEKERLKQEDLKYFQQQRKECLQQELQKQFQKKQQKLEKMAAQKKRLEQEELDKLLQQEVQKLKNIESHENMLKRMAAHEKKMLEKAIAQQQSQETQQTNKKNKKNGDAKRIQRMAKAIEQKAKNEKQIENNKKAQIAKNSSNKPKTNNIKLDDNYNIASQIVLGAVLKSLMDGATVSFNPKAHALFIDYSNVSNPNNSSQ